MKAGGIDVGNLANNHSYDYGPDAVADSRRNLEKAGIAPVGAGKDAEEAAEILQSYIDSPPSTGPDTQDTPKE